jgi:diacylglycerol kinase (ATP)
MKRLIRSFTFALKGLSAALKSEPNFKIYGLAILAVIILGVYLELAAAVWGLVILSTGFVLAAELFNTAVEKLGDLVAGGKQIPLIAKSKDIAAAAVLVAALTALVIGIIFLFIPLAQKIMD